MEVQALIITRARLVETWRLEVPGPTNGDLVVRTEFCGLCTPEQRVYRGSRPTYPYWGGHELSGIVQSVQSEQGPIKVGDRVAVLLMRRCGVCHACRTGLDNHCAYLQPEIQQGLPLGPGGLTDRIVVPSYKVFTLPPNLPAHQAALVEPIACVARGIDRARPRQGEFAAVIGGGTMGLIHTILLSLKGCCVYLFDDDETTHPIATQAGATFAGEVALLSDPENVRRWTEGWGFDLVFCTRFGVRGVEAGLAGAARGGRLVLYQSNPKDELIAFNPNILHYKEIEVIGTVAQGVADVKTALSLLADNSARFDVLRIEIIAASNPNEAFERAIDPQVNRVLVDLRSPFGE